MCSISSSVNRPVPLRFMDVRPLSVHSADTVDASKNPRSSEMFRIFGSHSDELDNRQRSLPEKRFFQLDTLIGHFATLACTLRILTDRQTRIALSC